MISIIAGTNRDNSQTLRVSKYYESVLKAKGVDCQLLDLSELPNDFVFSALYGAQNDEFNQITNKYVLEPSKLIIISPEYNGSFPGILKAFIDGWNPRQTPGKWAALTGVASGRQGNARGMDDLTNILNYLKINVIPVKPPMSQIFNLFNEAGELVDQGMKEVIELQIELLLEK